MNRCVAMKHLFILRSSLSYTDQKTYNSQEIGLAKDLCKKGYKVSVVLAGREECVETQDGCTVYYYAAGAVACIVFLVCIVWSCKIFRD